MPEAKELAGTLVKRTGADWTTRAVRFLKRVVRRWSLRLWSPFSYTATAHLQAQTVPQQAARDIGADPAIAVPLEWAESAHPPATRVAAIVHLFYDELALEVRSYLQSVQEGVDVYISTETARQAQLIREAFTGWSKGTVDVRLVPNIGRDIAPKLVACKDVFARYEYVVLLHGKRSKHASVLAPWRQFMFESLLGTPQVVRSILTIFDAHPKVGIVAVQHFEPVRRWLGWGRNFARSQLLARRMGFKLDPDRPLDFPSGSMFWVRSASLEPLLKLELQVEDFDPEQGQQDGTLAHAIEHLFFHVCEHAGYEWLKVGRPEFYSSTFDFESPSNHATLSSWMRKHRYTLLPPFDAVAQWRESEAVPGPSEEFFRQIRQRMLGKGKSLNAQIRVAVGMPVVDGDRSSGGDSIAAVVRALDVLESQSHSLFVSGAWDGHAADHRIQGVALPVGVELVTLHNFLMAQAFAAGATHYLAIGPGVVIDSAAIKSMLLQSSANFHRALIEGGHLACGHAAHRVSLDLDIPDVWLNCLLIPQSIFESLGGFDRELVADIAGIDFAWRARACGFLVKACPGAVVSHGMGHAGEHVFNQQGFLASAERLVRKWNGPEWLDQRIAQLAGHHGIDLPRVKEERVPREWMSYANFEASFDGG